MKKNSTKGYIVLGILFALVSIVAFAVPTIKTATFWIAYVFTAAAFAAQIIIWNKALGKEYLKSKLRDYETMIFEVRKYYPQFKKPDSKYGVIDRMDPPTSIGAHNLRTTDINYQKCLEADRMIDQRLQKYKDEIVQKQKRERREKYWSEHSAEKQQYEERLTAIDSELRTLRSQDTPYMVRIAEIKKDLSQPVSAESQLAELKKQQDDMVAQKSKLGLFAGKQKKALQAQIDSLQIQIDNVDATIKRMKQEIQDDVSARVSAVDAERKPITDRINALETEKNRINTELTKDR